LSGSRYEGLSYIPGIVKLWESTGRAGGLPWINYKQVHSTTQEVPYYRFQRALTEGKSLFREFKVPFPYQSVKDVFCLRTTRIIDAYRKISLNGLQLQIKNATPRETVTLRIYPLNKDVSEVRFWCQNKLVDVQKVKINAVEGVQF
jgi:hypothetical protein